MQLAFPKGVTVPRPMRQNCHVVAMGAIEGVELAKWREIQKPDKVLQEILNNIRKAYLKVGTIRADLSEYNIIPEPDMHILIINRPQYVAWSILMLSSF